MEQKRTEKRLGVFAVCFGLLFLGAAIPVSIGDDTPSSPDISSQEREIRSGEIERALKKAENLKEQKNVKSIPRDTDSEPPSLEKDSEGAAEKKAAFFPKDSARRRDPQSVELEKEQSETNKIPWGKEVSKLDQGPQKRKDASPDGRVSDAALEEGRFGYALLENATWEASEKKIVLRLRVSGQNILDVNIIRSQDGRKISLRTKGLVTRMRRTLSLVPSGVQSFFIREEMKLTTMWELEAPYYAVREIQTTFASSVQCSIHQEPGLSKVTFLLSKKIEPKAVEPAPVPGETMEKIQREALESPETTLGTSYQSQIQLEDSVLYGVRKPISIDDLYKRERENIEFKAMSGLPKDVRPILEAERPSFGSAEYFKKYIHGNIGQSFDFTTNYNYGSTSAYAENNSMRGEPARDGLPGKNIGTILGAPSIALLFYRPGDINVTAGYSASRDFPTTNNNFLYGFHRQNINLGIVHYSKKRYAFTLQNNLTLFGGMIRQKNASKWIKSPGLSQQGYRLNNNMGFNYRLNERLLWGIGGGMSRTRNETKTPGGRGRTLLGGLNTYLTSRLTSKLDIILGTDFSHVFKNTSGGAVSEPAGSVTTKGKNMQSVFLSAKYRYSKKLTFTGCFQGSVIDWSVGKVGGSMQITYQRTPHDDLSFRYSNSVVQDNTAMMLARLASAANASGVALQRSATMGLRYSRQFDREKTKGVLEVAYNKVGPLAGVFYGRTSGNTATTNNDLVFTASIQRAILKNRAWLRLLYSYEWAPNSIRNDVSGIHEKTSNTSQNIVVAMDYGF